jgi:hypothetical protein
MVAELTLFLSADGKVNVRVHTTRKKLVAFCVRDFVRMMANQDLSPTDAMTYWMSASSSEELRTEHEVQNQYGCKFQGAYEPRSVCISAAGLLMLLNYMDKTWGLIVEEYKEEVKQRLTILAEGGGAEFMWEYDDGEVDEMMAAKAEAQAKGQGLGDRPPDDWKFFFEDSVAPNPAIAKELQTVVDAIEAMQVEVNAAAEKEVVPKLDKKTAFSLKDLIQELELKVDSAYNNEFCKTVCARFREVCPGKETFTKKRRMFFYMQDKECLEGLIKEEYLKYTVRKAGEDFNEES